MIGLLTDCKFSEFTLQMQIIVELEVTAIVWTSAMGSSVETMCADSAFRKSYGIYHIVYRAKFQRSKAQPAANFLNHALILRSAEGRVLLERCLVGVFAFKIGDNTTGDELKDAFGCAEIYEFAGINQRRAGYTHVYFLYSGLKKVFYIVAKLSAAYNRVVAEYHLFVAEKVTVGNQFHFRHKLSAFLA